MIKEYTIEVYDEYEFKHDGPDTILISGGENIPISIGDSLKIGDICAIVTYNKNCLFNMLIKENQIVIFPDYDEVGTPIYDINGFLLHGKIDKNYYFQSTGPLDLIEFKIIEKDTLRITNMIGRFEVKKHDN